LRPTLAALALCGAGAFSPCVATTETYSPPPFGHYQPILDRMPFGALPANFGQTPADPAAAQTAAQVQAEQQKLAKQVNMSAVNITPDGQTAIGFTDLSAKPPVNYFLLVGASADGWKVVSADYDDEIATLEKDGVTITLQLGKGLVEPAAAQPPVAGKPAVPSLQPAPQPGQPGEAMWPNTVNVPGLIRRPGTSATLAKPLPTPGGAAGAPAARTAPQSAPSGETLSYKERLLERKTQQTEAEVAAAKKQQEQLLKLAREAAQKEIARREEEAALAAAEAAQAAPAAEEQHPQQEAPLQEGTVP
jgi:hypothetical protein